jgi:hypothetical protein
LPLGALIAVQLVRKLPAFYESHTFIREHVVAHLVEAQRYKPEDRGPIPNGITGIFY